MYNQSKSAARAPQTKGTITCHQTQAGARHAVTRATPTNRQAEIVHNVRIHRECRAHDVVVRIEPVPQPPLVLTFDFNEEHRPRFGLQQSGCACQHFKRHSLNVDLDQVGIAGHQSIEPLNRDGSPLADMHTGSAPIVLVQVTLGQMQVA